MTTQMIPLLMLAAHMIGDFVTQNQWMADNKFVKYGTAYRSDDRGRLCAVPDSALNFWDAALVRLSHVCVYTAGFIPIARIAFPADHSRGSWFLVAILVTHYVTDCRRWASGEKWPAKPLLVDQTIHITTLAVIGVLFGL